jgi:dipeptidyl aminopeptidase/acylaminoacyl peptidase
MAAVSYDFERYLNVRTAYGASFSPDGTFLSFLTDITGVAEVWSVPVDVDATLPAWPAQLTFRGERVMGAAFSPARDILLVSADTGGNERTQLYLLGADGLMFAPLTDAPETIYQFGGWSPDGARVCYSSNERDPRYFDVYERDIASGETRLLLQQDGTNYAARYSPDGRLVLVLRFDSNIRDQLWLIDTTTRDTRLLTPEISRGPARHVAAQWSADHQGLYLLSDRDRQFLSLAYLDLATDALSYLAEDQWDADDLALTHDGTRLALVTNEDGYSKLMLFDVAEGWERRHPLPAPALPTCVIREVTWSRDGRRLAFTLDTASDNPDIRVWDIDRQILWRATRSATAGIPRESFVAPSLVHYPTFDGREVPAFLFLPNTGQTEGLSIVVYVHGGPESQFRPSFNPVIQYFVHRGYGVLAPNVRGSMGYGYEYQSLDDVRLRMDSVWTGQSLPKGWAKTSMRGVQSLA